MAYVIGSDEGKRIANAMKAGESWTNPADGSKWSKQADGSVSVKTSKGETFNNAYTPTSSGGGSSGGGSSYSGGGGGSYSQYTAPTLGSTWDANTDYQAIINNAVNNGDYVTAAKAEQLRNQKIIGQGLNQYDTTNYYQGWLDPRDISNEIRDGMRNGMSSDKAQTLYDERYGKALGTVGLEQYADDKLMKNLQEYILRKQESEMRQQWNKDNMEKPEEYTRPYDPQIDALLSQILNRKDFNYDLMDDPLYQQYAQMYQREGDRAMKETMAEAAAGAGGMNTYAITAAQQANSYYNSQLNDKIPELYQLAYNMYLNDKESQVQNLGILQNMDATQYNRYRDTINDYYADKNFAYKAYQDAVQQGNWQTQFNYNSNWDKIKWDYQLGRDQIYDNRYDSETSYEKDIYNKDTANARVEAMIEEGEMPSDELIAQTEWDKADVLKRVNAKRREKGLLPIGSATTGGYT